MTSVGTTILLKLEEAQKHLNNGRVTFLPSASPGSKEVAEAVQDSSKPDIMREKVALNLPVVMTKRTNKKVAQDNPFYRWGRTYFQIFSSCFPPIFILLKYFQQFS